MRNPASMGMTSSWRCCQVFSATSSRCPAIQSQRISIMARPSVLRGVLVGAGRMGQHLRHGVGDVGTAPLVSGRRA